MRLRLFPLLAAIASVGLAQNLIAAPQVPVVASPDGSSLFERRCLSCHSLEAGRTNPAGPNLAGIIGRKAAAGDYRYSPALRQSNITWTPAKLEEFLAGPAAMVPGTRMFMGVNNMTERNAIVDYLAGRKG